MGKRDRVSPPAFLTVRALFRFLPTPFWCYMLPMLASSFGRLPRESPVYSFASQQLLPVCLVLMLIGTDLKSLARLGMPATRIMLAGSAGTILGGLVGFFLYRRWLPPGSSGAVGALAGSWIGGSANLLAVKEALGVPDSLIAPIILVDALVAYSWMALLIAASAWQAKWDRFLGLSLGDAAMRRSLRPSVASLADCPASLVAAREPFRDTVPARPPRSALPHPPVPALLFALTLSISLSLLAQAIAARLPILPGISASTWTVMLVTTIALFLSTTPLRQLEEAGASRIGKWALYLLLITIGARANIRAVVDAPVFLALGLTWIVIHGLVLLAAGYFWRAPLGLIATASQANIGGPVSAPVVGATYSAELAGIGLLMAILGNILGTYLGLLTAWVLRTGCG